MPKKRLKMGLSVAPIPAGKIGSVGEGPVADRPRAIFPAFLWANGSPASQLVFGGNLAAKNVGKD